MTQRGARTDFQRKLRARGVEVVEFDFLTPHAVAAYCYDRGFLQCLWECGGTLSAPAIAAGVIHKTLAFIAPKLVRAFWFRAWVEVQCNKSCPVSTIFVAPNTAPANTALACSGKSIVMQLSMSPLDYAVDVPSVVCLALPVLLRLLRVQLASTACLRL